MADNKKQQNENQKIAPLSNDWNHERKDSFIADNAKPPPRQPDKDDKNERR